MSAPVHPRCFVCCVVCVFPAPAWGCKGLSSHGSSTPCPWAVRGFSLVSRETPTLAAARYAPRARAAAPAPRRTFNGLFHWFGFTIRPVRPRRWGEQAGPPHERCVLFCESSLSMKCSRLAVPSDGHRPRLSGRCRRSVVAMFWARFRRNRLLSVSPHCYGRTETQTAGSSV